MLARARAVRRGRCMKDPGFEVDIVVHADVGTLARVWAGHTDLAAGRALRSGIGW